MPIERLIYNRDRNNFLELRYVNNNTIGANQSINTIFTHAGEKIMNTDCEIAGVTFRMGWDTAVVFEKQKGGSLIIKQIYDIKKKQIRGVKNGVLFQQITTQAVDTCTLVYIETDNECLLAHFGVKLAGDFKTFAENIFSNAKSVKYILYSGGGKKAYQEVDDVGGIVEIQNIQRGYNSLVQWMHDRKPKPVMFARMAPLYAEGSDRVHYFSHMEFGIGWDGKATTYFGDVVSRQPSGDSDNNTSPCLIFEYKNIKDLNKMGEWAKIMLGSAAEPTADPLEKVEIEGDAESQEKSSCIIQ